VATVFSDTHTIRKLVFGCGALPSLCRFVISSVSVSFFLSFFLSYVVWDVWRGCL